MREPVIVGSARRHGVSDRDMLHAFRHEVRIWELDDGFTMIVGPKADGGLIEVGYVRRDDGVVIVVHALDPARRKFLRW